MTHDSGRCLLHDGGLENSDGDNDDNDEGNQMVQGNPGGQIEELGENGPPVIDDVAEGNDNPQGNQNIAEQGMRGQLSDIDPHHNALEGISSGEWASEGINTINTFPSFVTDSGAPPSAKELLDRELRKRKQIYEDDESFSPRKKKIGFGFQSMFNNMEEGSGSGESSHNNQIDGAAVGPVPPPVP